MLSHSILLSMFDGIMLSGDDYIAHYLILIKPENSDIVKEENVSAHTLHPLSANHILKLSGLRAGCFLLLSPSFFSRQDAFLRPASSHM